MNKIKLNQAKLISFVLSLVLSMGLVPTMVFAAEQNGRALETIYLDGSNGDDSRDAATADTAVKTLNRALELVSDNGTVLIVDSVHLEDAGEITLNNGDRNITFKRMDGNIHHLFVLKANTALTLKNVTIDGNGKGTGISVKNGAALNINDGTKITNFSDHAVIVNSDLGEPVSNVTMTGGEISNVMNTSYTGANGTVVVGEDGIFTMNGGVIKDNYQVGGGGAVYVTFPESDDTKDRIGKFYMNGGIIENNNGGDLSGGGIQNYGYCELNSGIIKNNRAAWGGGVATVGIATTVINNVTITGNACSGNGAGVYVEGFNPNGNPNGVVTGEATVIMNGGNITNNVSNNGYGGGIFAYAGGYPTAIEMNGGTISDNRVREKGTAIALYGKKSYDYARLKLKNSPTIIGDVFMRDDVFNSIKVDVVGEFSPTQSIVLNDTSWTDFRTVVRYADGLTRDLSHFTTIQPVPPRDVIPDEKDSQNILSINKLLVEFYSDNALVGSSYVVPDTVINSVDIPTVTKQGYSLTGWTLDDGARWDFKTDTVANDPTKLYAVWEKLPIYTVTYTDGVEGEEIFADQVITDIVAGSKTPGFNGSPVRDGYNFSGWCPAISDTVTQNATYIAQWEKTAVSTPDVPDTGDPADMILWVLLLIAAVECVLAQMLRRNKTTK